MHERVRRLERDGLGVGFQALVTAELRAHSRDVIEGFEVGVLCLPEARARYHLTGRFDYLLHIPDAQAGDPQ